MKTMQVLTPILLLATLLAVTVIGFSSHGCSEADHHLWAAEQGFVSPPWDPGS